MAFTMTMLAWSAVDFGDHLSSRNELSNALGAIRWGTDYLINAHPDPDVLYGEVGDGYSDHDCWQRPEDMTTPRTAYRIDDQHPGSDLAAETAAALAAASIAFRQTDRQYANQLLGHAKQLFEFACNHQGLYQNSIGVAGGFYSSSGYEDELVWAAAWLHRATNDGKYLDFLSTRGTDGTRSEFSWDDKFVGAQVLIAKLVLEGRLQKSSGTWGQYKNQAEQFICSCLQKGNSNLGRTPGGLLWIHQWNNFQYVAAASFIASVYSDYLQTSSASIQCPGGSVGPSDLISFAQSQVDYMLGSNPKNMSYMVGYGSKYPTEVHHRGASIISIKKDPTPVTCRGGYGSWFNQNGPNPNVLDGAIVGGPDQSDGYYDSRNNFQQAEPATVNVAPFTGVLARLA
ncbi:endoglucanase 14-like [Tripterygium wilfordii]|uniref:Endoglucanase n=1 Tax=Tripterygium wilfordii TaxID=458696 RepID=A0A7J7CF97_TRIWF|nr:endoglucanase 13-like [Tripterygium wilfordii]KAF5732821.1 endoglucanase 14-like [Tripterygium wilfordii]